MLSELVGFLGLLAGRELPVEYRGEGMEKTRILVTEPGTTVTEKLGALLERSLARHGLNVERVGGRIVVSPRGEGGGAPRDGAP
jgi:hypothetical protein